MSGGKEGPEDRLGPELEAALNNREPESKEYLTPRPLADALGNDGSQNWGPLAWAVRLLRGVAGAREEWLRFFERSKEVWMGSEVGTRIYWAFHLLSVVAVFEWALERNDDTLAEAARGWLRQWWLFVRAVRTDDGRVLLLGNRSAGHVFEAGFLEFVVALAFQEDTSRWMGAMHAAKWGPEKRWEYRCALALYRALQASAEGVEGTAPSAGMLGAFHVYRTEHGLAVWLERGVNSNTAPVLAAVEIDGQIQTAPANGGAWDGPERPWRSNDGATCRRGGDSLAYTSRLFGGMILALPPGRVIASFAFGAAQEDAGPEIPPVPVPPPPQNGDRPVKPPSARPWWRRFFDLFT